MPEVEFVNRDLAESEAARAVVLLNSSDEAKVEAWFAMQAVADQVGPASNVGVRGLAWRPDGGGCYKVQASCVDGRLWTTIGGPATLEEARSFEWLGRVRETFERLVSGRGGLSAPDYRPDGVGNALVEAVNASPAGREWLARFKGDPRGPHKVLLNMVKVCDRYGENVYSGASLYAHIAFLGADDRAQLVREFPNSGAAKARAMSLRAGTAQIPESPRVHIAPTKVNRLAIKAGVSRREARVILLALLEGRSKTKLMRAVAEGVRMVDEMKAREARAA